MNIESGNPLDVTRPFSIAIRKCFVLFSAAVLCGLLLPSIAFSQKDANGDSLKVGDTIEFEFMGETFQSEVTKFTKGGWPYVEFEWRGRTKERFFADNRVTLIDSADGATSELEQRTWTDASGSFTIDAVLQTNKDGKLRLETDDGRVIELEVDQLSAADQKYLAELQKAGGDEANADNPFAGGKAKRGGKTSGASRVKAITPGLGDPVSLSDANWNVPADPKPSGTALKKVIGYSTNFGDKKAHSRLATPSLSPDGKSLASVVSNPFSESSDIVLVDLETGKAAAPAKIPYKDCTLLATSDGNEVVVTIRKSRMRDPGRLDFWTIADGKATQSATWETDRQGGFAPTSGQFIGPNRLLTFGNNAVLWDVEKAEAIYSVAISKNIKPAVSPGGKLMALAANNAVYFVNVADGEMLGSIDLPSSTISSFAFSQSGKLLAGASPSSSEVFVWELESQKLTQQFGVASGAVRSLLWCGDQYVLVNNSWLMDVQLQAAVWQYTPTSRQRGSIFSAQDGRFWFVGTSRVVPLTLPHRDLAARTEKLDPEDLVVFQPGSEVELVFDNLNPGDRQKARNKLTAALEANDVEVVKNSDLVMVVSLKRLESEQMKVSSLFSGFGRRSDTETISFTPHFASVQLKNGDKVLWSKTRRFGPRGIIHCNDGESAQSAAARICKPNFGFLDSVILPKQISQLPSGMPFGTSTIDEKGIR